MQTPLQISFHGVDHSEALEENVRKHVEALDELFDRITSCRVVIEKPHRSHRNGNIYHVHIHLAVPQRELVVHREPEQDPSHEDPYITVRDAFQAMRRQLQEYVRELRGEVKSHQREAE